MYSKIKLSRKRVIALSEKFKSTLQFDIDFDKFKEEYPYLFWLEEVLKFNGFLEEHGFKYVPQMGYRASDVLPKAEIDALFRKILEAFPWAADCTTHFDCVEMGEPKSILHLFTQIPEEDSSKGTLDKV